MLRHSFGEHAAAEAIEDAVKRTISAGVMTADIVRDGQTPCGTQASATPSSSSSRADGGVISKV